MKPIKVLIVDDSRLIRRILTECLETAPDIHVIGEAEDPFDAREKIKALNPDVLTLDIDMPGMDGLSFLEKLMRLHPMPVVMVSKLTQAGAMPTVYALALGAVETIGKPSADKLQHNLQQFADSLIEKIRIAASAKVQKRVIHHMPARLVKSDASNATQLIALGASTGGVETLCSIFAQLPTGLPPIVITQHMPPVYTTSFAARLDSLSEVIVHEATDGDILEPGHAYLAPGDRHLLVRKNGNAFYCQLSDGELVSGHKPSVDMMFRSVAEAVGAHALGIILTGMGRDGATGLLAMRKSGATTLGQSEASCVIYGMPRAAAAMGATIRELPPGEIAAAMTGTA